ncbi:MAG: hypothetical protein ACRBCT_03325 [Alphaproteobacteria bacterium]
MIEKPFRNREVIGRKLLLALLIATAAVLGIVHWNFIDKDGYQSRVPAILATEHHGENQWEIYRQNDRNCFGRQDDFCTEFVSGDATRLYALGDSHLASLVLSERFNGQFLPVCFEHALLS